MNIALTLLLAAAPSDTPICTDRPTKANAVCTVPVGNWQLESSAASWSRTEVGGNACIMVCGAHRQIRDWLLWLLWFAEA